ncbi:Translation initiation factor IF-2, mitochondrial [Colletotrichum musicola]|uniref:Translation initiation factor IF-2, mitochondrial n=1 Tax=Colletotrichum musicola TaxID=2175873 RepID=A0A8H6KTR2_9PEZI|nr:Translation initiation factor IF-2, mitochondrial [Colletotrichum musicola]
MPTVIGTGAREISGETGRKWWCSYACALCRHPALARQRDGGRRNYSDASNSSSNSASRPAALGGWGAGSGAKSTGIPPRPVGPTSSSGWGKPAFGGSVPKVKTSGPPSSGADASKTSSPVVEDLLPHEIAARERLKKTMPKPAPPPPPPPSPKTPPTAERRATSQVPISDIFQRRSDGGAASGRATSQAKVSEIFQRRNEGDVESERATSQLKTSDIFQRRSEGERSAVATGFGQTFRRVSSRPADGHPSELGARKDGPGARPWRANAPPENDWRHRGLEKNPLPGSERKLQSTPIPHHRHHINAVREELGAPPLRSKTKQEQSAWGKLDEGKAGSWGLLARKPNKNSVFADDSAKASISKDDFISKFQNHVGSKFGEDAPKASAAGTETAKPDMGSDGFVEEVVQVEEPSRQRREFDESYEIQRDSRKRDKAGSRRGEAGSYRGSKKSFAQQRWEDENEAWDESGARQVADRRRRKAEEKARRKAEAEAAAPQTIFLPEFISIANLGVALKMKPQDFLRALGEMGFEDITEESIMTGETACLVAMEFGFEPTVDTGASRDLRPRPPPEDPSIVPPRPPVVTIMGHVDHGKTTLLDYLRKSSVAAQEHGGITQHIGAFVVKMSSGKLVTFLDTPGHAAFLTMRQRGANVTDIVVLVVAADDSVKPQTLEAIKHARSSKVPIIVAINKIDKEDARPDQVKADLSRHGVEIEDFGGDVQVVCVSGKTGQGMDELEENIVALAEIQDMRAEEDGMAEAWVLEASVKPHGKSANMLVKRGTLRPGDYIVAGTTFARVRMLRNEAGQELDEAPPGTPVEVLGWRDELPAAGDEALQAPDEDRARTAVDYRVEMQEREALSKQLAEQEQREREAKAAKEAEEAEEAKDDESEAPTTKVVNFIVRGDVVGSVEAVCATINEIGNNEVKSRILRSAAGQVSETDVEHAATSKSTIVSFNSPLSGHIRRLAEDKGVRILDHTIIYHLADEVKQVMSESLADKISTKVVGEAEILQVFSINTRGRHYKNIAGCRVRNGAVTRSATLRILRKGEVIFDGALETLKQGKKDATEIKKGAECGMSFEGFTDFKVGDQIQMYEEVREKRKL